MEVARSGLWAPGERQNCETREASASDPNRARDSLFETFLVRLNGLLVVQSEPSPVCSLMNIFFYNFG